MTMAVKHIVLAQDIDDDSVSSLIKQIYAINDGGAYDSIVLDINSGGGGLYAAFALCNVIRLSEVAIDTRVIGVCGSAAVPVLQAGRERMMVAPLSTLMIHHSTTSPSGRMSVPEALEEMEESRRNEGRFHKLVADRIGMSESEYLAFMGARRYLSPEEALELNFIDEIVELPSR